MKYRLMDVLACPYDKTFPLTLIVLREKEYPERSMSGTRDRFVRSTAHLRTSS